MFEPFYLPQLNQTLLPLDNVRFCISRNKQYVQPDDPDLDPLHIHDSLEIFINVKGDSSFLIDNKLYHVPGGNAVIVEAQHVHMCIHNQSEMQEHFCIWINAPENSPINSVINSAGGNKFAFASNDWTTLVKLLNRLNDIRDDNDDKLEKTVCFLQILSLFINQKSNSTVAKIPDDLQSILDDIHINFANIERIEQIASRHFISLSTMNRRFRQFIHLSPKKLLESEKLSAAAKLLADGATVTEACIRSGFSDCSYFITLFKKKFGETPYKYKCKFTKNQ